MHQHIKGGIRLLLASAGLASLAQQSAAQGCEPIRFTTPVNLGGEGQAYQPNHEWQLTLAYRRLFSNEFFVGTTQNPALGPFGQSPVFSINTVVADVAYAISDRFRVRVSIPFSSGTVSRKWADQAIHEQSASGIGDVSVMGEAWLFTPRTHARGNVSVGLGVKAPTGSYLSESKFYGATSVVDFPADQTIQPGDGGWAALFQTQAFQQISKRTFGYAFASYMVSPKAQSDAVQSPGSTLHWSVPDVYSARLGAAYALLPEQGLSVSLGLRMDGIPVHDLVGGGDDVTIKRSSSVLFADPGMSLNVGRSTFTLSVPYRLGVERKKSVLEQNTNGVNGGGFAKYLVFAGYTYRL